MRSVSVLFLLFALIIAAVVADPREVENEAYMDLDEASVPDVAIEKRVSIALEHNIGPEASSVFSPRGSVEVLFGSSLVKPQATFKDTPSLSEVELQEFQSLLANNGYYMVRARSDPEDASSHYVAASIPICMLAAVKMHEDLAFHMSDDGQLIGIEFLTPYISPSTCSQVQKKGLSTAQLTPHATVFLAQPGASPPKNVGARKDSIPKGVKPAKADGEEEAVEENPSFFRKYWYIILPIVIFSLVGGQEPQAAGAPAGRR